MTTTHHTTRSTAKGGGTPLFSADGRAVAAVKTDAQGRPYAEKTYTGSRHALRKPPGLAIDRVVLDAAKRAGCLYFRATDRETGRVHVAPLAAFDSLGFLVSRGFGEQVGLAWTHWTEVPPGLALTPPTPIPSALAASVAAQAPLFEVGA